MTFQYSLQKVLDIKEKEKQKKEFEYSEAVSMFEEQATELYHLLKKKEAFEENWRNELEKGISIQEIRMQQLTLTFLENEIAKKQQTTNEARDTMYRKQHDLQLSAVETKKYEKMKQLKLEAFMEEEKRAEIKLMDEISLQSYVYR